MSDIVGTFRSYAHDKDNMPRMETEVVYVRVKHLLEAAARIEQLEGQHKDLVLQNALLRQRPDLPVDRIPAAAEVRALIARIEQLEAALREIAGLGVIIASDMAIIALREARAALEERT